VSIGFGRETAEPPSRPRGMFDPRNQSRRAAASKALVALIGATGCLAAVAYAASDPAPGRSTVVGAARVADSVLGPRPGGPRPSRPQITKHPAKTTLSTRVSFRFVTRLAQQAFQCKLDANAWKPCAARVAYRGLDLGAHLFLVRAEDGGKRSLPARFSWLQSESQGFLIQLESADLSRLYPGAPPVTLPLLLSNPNPAPILVTKLRVAVSADPPGCPSASNLELIPASASAKAPVKIPAGGSVRLPAAGATPPALALRDLPVNQDACQGAQFPLAFSGEAHG
jgi:hypothetical protein